MLRRFNSHLNQMSSPGTSAKLHKIHRSLYWYNKIFSDTTASSVFLDFVAAKLTQVSRGDFCASLKCNLVIYLLPQTSRQRPDQKFASAKFSRQNRKKTEIKKLITEIQMTGNREKCCHVYNDPRKGHKIARSARAT